MNVNKIEEILAEFTKRRDWDKFHSPKNLVMALSVEASELVEIFQWMTEEQSYDLDKEKMQHVKEEIADVTIYILSLCRKLDIDLESAILSKIEMNGSKYPETIPNSV